MKTKRIGFDNPAATIYWLAPSMAITLGILSAILENWPSILRSDFFQNTLVLSETVFYLAAPGVVAFCMVWSEF